MPTPQSPTPRVQCQKCVTCFDGTIELCEAHSRAVNAHEELLKSAKEALSTLEKGKAFSPDSKLAIALNLHKAIAYAEGE